MSKDIQLSAGYITTIDDDDFERVSQFKWSASIRRKDGEVTKVYAFRQVGPKKKRESVYLHRFIMEAAPDICVDHRNSNGLDNRRENLRLATHAQNQHNRGKHPKNRSGFKGVTWNIALGKWHSQIKVNSGNVHLGYFTDIVEAAEAYKQAAARLHGDFAQY